MASQLFLLPFRPAISAQSLVIPGAQLSFYQTGTLIRQAVFTDATMGTPLSNPVVANAAGVWPSIYFDNSKVYRVQLLDKDGTILKDTDPYLPSVIDGLSQDVINQINTVSGAVAQAQSAATTATNAANGVSGALTQIGANTSQLKGLYPANVVSPWTPALSNPLAWYSPLDKSTITFNSDGTVAAVSDKSGNGWNLTASGKVTYTTATPNPAVYFDGSGGVLTSTNLSLAEPVSFYASVYPTGGGATYQTVVDVGNKLIFRSSQGGGVSLFAGTSITGGGLTARPHGMAGSISPAGAGALFTEGGPQAYGNTGTNSATNVPLRVGNSPAADAPLTGYLADVLVYNFEVIPNSDLGNKLMGYNAWNFDFHELLPTVHPYRYCPPVTGPIPTPAQVKRTGTTMIPAGPSGSWYETNIFDPRVIEDPTDSTKLMMYVSGQAAPVGNGKASIGLFRASKASPFSWTFDSVVLVGSTNGNDWDGKPGGVRLCDIKVMPDGSIRMYYVSQLNATEMGIAISNSTGRVFTKYGSNPVLSPNGQGRNDGTDISTAAIINRDGQWTCIYSYRTTDDILPGYRYAYSTDGLAWTKGGNGDILSRPHRDLQLESVQSIERNGKFYLVFEMGGSISNGCPYRNFVAESANLRGPYTLKKMIVAETGAGNPDGYHVATPFLFSINGQDILFWQGTGGFAQPYYNNKWSLFGAYVANALA